MKTILKVALGIILGLTVLIVACSALIATGLDEAEEKQQEKGITASQFRAIPQGTTERAVRAKLGEPENRQDFEQNIPELNTGTRRSSCIYYPEKDKPLFRGESFQFCFDGGKLTSKNAY